MKIADTLRNQIEESSAEKFLREQVAAETDNGLGHNWDNLRALPFVLYSRVARLMEEYHQSQVRVGGDR